MPDVIAIQGVHHLTFTVTDVERSWEFYRSVLDFTLVRRAPLRILMRRKGLFVSLTPAAANQDRFDETRVGLDHISFKVRNYAQLEQAVTLFDQRSIPHGEIKDLSPLPVHVLAFRDPDNIQLELTALYPLRRLLPLFLSGKLR